MYSIEKLLKIMVESNASDLYLSLGAFPMLKIEGKTIPLEKDKITEDTLNDLEKSILSDEQQMIFKREHELDFAYSFPGVGRFRINYFKQRGTSSIVLHQVLSKIRNVKELNLPAHFNDLVLNKRGIILVVGQVGCGKSTTLAALIDHRNKTMPGHILTLEDPIEFLHQHKKSIVNQREIGNDTLSFAKALKSALREAPDMLLIGEIRDRESMLTALNFAETGHLVLSTLHAANVTQAIERIFNMHGTAYQDLIRMQLSENICAIISQRLVVSLENKLLPATEILLPSARVRDLIRKGDTHLLHSTIEFAKGDGMQSFDQCLYDMYQDKKIDLETAIRYADHQTDLTMKIKSGERHQSTEKIELVTADDLEE
jgi:twitching motility protein PilU